MILTATWVGTWQFAEAVQPETFDENPSLLTVLTFMAFDLVMATIIFMPEVWL